MINFVNTFSECGFVLIRRAASPPRTPQPALQAPRRGVDKLSRRGEIRSQRSRAEPIQEWFYPTAFDTPAHFTFRNTGRANGSGPGAVRADLSVLKHFRLREGYVLHFRTGALNFLNKPNFSLPSLSRGSPMFGQITSVIGINSNRILQFGFVYTF